MEALILAPNGQLTIPKRLRNKYGINSGIKVTFEETDKGILLIPMNKKYFKSFAGILKKGNLKEEIKEMRQEAY
jgi:AbrB family looped-hinge helix DNA binding protein